MEREGLRIELTEDDVVTATRDRAPELQFWVWRVYRSGDLLSMVEAVMRGGKASEVAKALEHLIEAASALSFEPRVAKADFDFQAGRHQVFNELTRTLDAEADSAVYDLFRLHGQISHNTIPRFICGETIRGYLQQGPMEQVGLFEPQGSPLSDVAAPTSYNFRQLLLRIERNWRALSEAMQRGVSVHTLLASKKATIRRLYQNLALVYGRSVQQLWRYGTLDDEYMIFNTLMSWAAATLWAYKRKPEPLFRELAIFWPSNDLGGGRIDAASVAAIRGHTPTRDEKKLLFEMAEHRYHSVGHLVKHCIAAFGEVSLVIREWKFSIGDGIGSVLRPDDIRTEPLKPHREQVEQYLTLAALSANLNLRLDRARWWEVPGCELRGEITYFFPQSFPITHSVLVREDEPERIFIEKIASQWSDAERRAILRQYNATMGRYSLHVLEGSPRFQPRRSDRWVQPGLITGGEPTRVKSLVEKYREGMRQYLGKLRLIEVTYDQQRRVRYQLHINRLLDAIEEGEVETSKIFSEVRGGHIICPVHEERTPSFHVSFTRGMFKCFGCGIMGTFAAGSVPHDIEVSIKPFAVAHRENRATRKVVMPDELRRIMGTAALSLERALPGSDGERYLISERGLDPYFARSFGVGYGTLSLIDDLLDAGFTYENLIAYGFVGTSPRVSTHGYLVRHLLHRGMTLKQLVRQEVVKEHGARREVPSYPYSVLNRRVTFPLVLGGIINSFYGRIIDPDALSPKHLRHRKLKIEAVYMPHGAFNMAAVHVGASLLVLTEGAIDGLTFVEAAQHPETIALIGVDNDAILEEVAGFGGDIATALDLDPVSHTGEKQTPKLMAKLRRKGFQGRLFNWTQRFVRGEMPAGRVYKDLNKYWVDHRDPVTVGFGPQDEGDWPRVQDASPGLT